MHKIALLILFLITISSVIIFPIAIKNEENILNIFIGVGILIGLCIFTFKHLKVLYAKEILTIENKQINYQNTFLGLGNQYSLKANKIKQIKYVGYKNSFPKNEISYLYSDGTILIKTDSEGVRFGHNVAEEDAEEIKQAINHYI